MEEEFWLANPTIARTIQVHGDQTLTDLHYAINESFGRDDDHLYAFSIPDPERRRYGKELILGALLSSLNLRVGRVLCYRYDFGDDWKHDVKVTAVGAPEPDETYPKVIQTIGESPPQYPYEDDDWDDEDMEDLPEAAAADVSLLIGEMHLKDAEFARAVDAFTRSIEANPEAADEYEGRARAYRALAEEDERTARELRAAPPRAEKKG